jgi:hypothetical protein
VSELRQGAGQKGEAAMRDLRREKERNPTQEQTDKRPDDSAEAGKEL